LIFSSIPLDLVSCRDALPCVSTLGMATKTHKNARRSHLTFPYASMN
jgi:hypothetical protein